jgi:hypothetical protein
MILSDGEMVGSDIFGGGNLNHRFHRLRRFMRRDGFGVHQLAVFPRCSLDPMTRVWAGSLSA